MSITKLTSNGLTGSKYDTVSADNYYMEPIATTLLSGTSSAITFSDIPQNYKHLQVRGIARTDYVSTYDALFMQFNNDLSTSNYVQHVLSTDGATVGAGYTATGTADSAARFGDAPGTTTTASVFSAFIIDILDYTNVNKYKTMRSLGGFDANGSGRIGLRSALWLNTAPISTIKITDLANLKNLIANSRFSLYGIKG